MRGIGCRYGTPFRQFGAHERKDISGCGTAYRLGGTRFRRPCSDRAGDRPAFAAGPLTNRAVPDGFRIRGGARPLHAALFPTAPLPPGPPGWRGYRAETAPVRILGA